LFVFTVTYQATAQPFIDRTSIIFAKSSLIQMKAKLAAASLADFPILSTQVVLLI